MYKKRCYNDYFVIGTAEVCSTEEILDLTILKEMILDHFEELGLDFDYKRKVIYKNKEDKPFFCVKQNKPSFINLHVKSMFYWSQVIFQLSHEMTHCFIECHNPKVMTVSWIEETICEAMSLYFLNFYSKNWKKCELEIFNANYNKYIEDYLDDNLEDEGTDRLENCSSLKELKDIEKTSTTQREDRNNEMKKLFTYIKKENIEGLINYRDYIIEDSILLDTKKYRSKYPDNKAVEYICSLQDNILLREKNKDTK